ncbi:magnesium/cobalt transporter CorA [Rubrivivax gelatinosus]|uniref:Magnesium transport protein CorA n=1 Tax=Rubrivivax gelatinosus (strain NBRC 100245 / IL144) TaxID=983917 RepID=I0HWM9_RUBGI|nr:magnesium/cobalt transporter CorA [Rubrivivax gelatinosus]BAL97416.1 magnesium and cobalt transport protein CorA [Rubrivivax gelatinosus IL144]
MLINCVAYRHGVKLADIAVEAISDHLSVPDTLVWVALRDPSDEELATMQREFGLHELAVEDARHGHQRPKIEEYGDMLFTVVHLLEYGPTDELQRGELAIFAGPNYVVSVRNGSTQGFVGVRARCERSPELLKQGAGFVFYALLDAAVDRYFPLVEELENLVDGIETQIFEPGAARRSIEQLYDVKRRLGVLRHAVLPLVDPVMRLHGSRTPTACTGTQEYFRDVSDHLMRINGTLDALRETVTTAIQVNLSMVTIEESETTKRLAAWAGIFAVATAFVGVWGMNFKYMPELDWRWGYPAALGVIGSVCALMYWRFKKLGWL